MAFDFMSVWDDKDRKMLVCGSLAFCFVLGRPVLKLRRLKRVWSRVIAAYYTLQEKTCTELGKWLSG